MSVTDEQLAGLRDIYPKVRRLPEGGKEFIYTPQLKVTVDGQVKIMDGLLCPEEHGGYLTRLFLSEPVPNKATNWSTHTICGRTWHTWSYNNIPATLPLPQILLEHLRALR